MLPDRRSTDSTARWQVSSTLVAGMAESVTLGRLASDCCIWSTPKRPASLPERSHRLLACSRISTGSTHTTQECWGRCSTRLAFAFSRCLPVAAEIPSVFTRSKSAHSTWPRLRWLSAPKWRMESTSSPKNSKRAGEAASGDQASISPPRRAKSPGNSTASEPRYPASTSQSTSSSISTVCPRSIRLRRASSDWGLATGCSRACTLVSRIFCLSPTPAKAPSVLSRAGVAGSMRSSSPGRQLRAGKICGDEPVKLSSSWRQGSKSRGCASATRSTPGHRLASAATAKPDADPQAPSIVALLPAESSRKIGSSSGWRPSSRVKSTSALGSNEEGGVLGRRGPGAGEFGSGEDFGPLERGLAGAGSPWSEASSFLPRFAMAAQCIPCRQKQPGQKVPGATKKPGNSSRRACPQITRHRWPITWFWPFRPLWPFPSPASRGIQRAWRRGVR